MDELFDGLDYVRIEDTVTSDSELIKEIWRLFLVAMLVALLLEAALCLPDIRDKSKEAEPAI